jgi:hypothetical protein
MNNCKGSIAERNINGNIFMTRYKNSHVDYIGHGIVPFYPCLYT